MAIFIYPKPERKKTFMSSEFTPSELHYLSNLAHQIALKEVSKKDLSEFNAFAGVKNARLDEKLITLNQHLLNGNVDANVQDAQYGLQQLVDNIDAYQDEAYRQQIGSAAQYLDNKKMLDHIQTTLNQAINN